MRRLVPYLIIAMLLWGLSVPGPRPAAAQSVAPSAATIDYPLPPGVRFIHSATVDTLYGDATLMANPATNDQPSALVFATHNYNPGGGVGARTYRAVGANYVAAIQTAGSGPAGQWSLYNEDGANFDSELSYNVMVTAPGQRAFVATASVTNTSGNSTTLNHYWLDGQLDRIPFILHNLNPNWVVAGSPITSPLGVWWTGSQWAIFAEDNAVLPLNAAYNVMVGLPGANVFTHTATVDNILGGVTLLDHPLANGNRNALILVTQSWNPNGALVGVSNPHHIGVFYSASQQKWFIDNEDEYPIPLGASFSVLIDEAHLFLPVIVR